MIFNVILINCRNLKESKSLLVTENISYKFKINDLNNIIERISSEK